MLIQKYFMELGNSLLDFVFPAHCLLCSVYLPSEKTVENIEESYPSNLVCLDCWKSLNILPYPFCPMCRSYFRWPADNPGRTWRCPKCKGSSLALNRSLGLFDTQYQTLIHNFKYRRKTNLGRELGKRLGKILKKEDFLKEVDYIIPVPLNPTRKRERGYNQSKILAEEISRISSLPILDGLLLRKRSTKDQTNLSPDERDRNVKGAFSTRDNYSIRRKNILLVDDVMTTGATLRECSRVLKQAGARMIIGTTIAAVN